jgi:L,D-transpeptidase catalytic domain
MKAFFILSSLLLIASCSNQPPGSDYMAGLGGSINRPASGGPHHPAPAIPDDVSYWDGDGVSGSPLIKINRSQQKAYFYKSGILVGVSRISSGKEDTGTPAGSYKISQKNKYHKSSVYGVIKDRATGQMINDNADNRVDKVGPGQVFYNAPMPNFMRFNNGIGMHTGYLPGYAASHGCVRMPHHMSEKFFDNVAIGTPVIVE